VHTKLSYTVGINLPLAVIGVLILMQMMPSSKYYDSYLLALNVKPPSTVG